MFTSERKRRRITRSVIESSCNQFNRWYHGFIAYLSKSQFKAHSTLSFNDDSRIFKKYNFLPILLPFPFCSFQSHIYFFHHAGRWERRRTNTCLNSFECRPAHLISNSYLLKIRNCRAVRIKNPFFHRSSRRYLGLKPPRVK